MSAVDFLLRLVFDLATFLFLARFVLQATGANFYNPVSQALVKITDPVLRPVRTVLPSLRNIDLASFVFAWAAVFGKLFFLTQASGVGFMIGYSALQVLILLLTFFQFAIIGVVIVSFLIILGFVSQANPHPLILLLYEITEPLLGPVRRLLPDLGGIDFSPLIVLVGLQMLTLVLGDAFGFIVGALV